ncbi:hypothetical protein B566_EDAN014888 [Ephemera danica]|nr:hypothetical protein B566_EDAN014888 [Ephemera danica]
MSYAAMFSILLLVCMVGQLNAQLCYPYTDAAGAAAFYICRDKYVIPCTSAAAIGPRAGTPVDCSGTDVAAKIFGGGIASTNLCYPNQEALNVCGPTPPCPATGTYPISNRGIGCKSFYTCVETNAAGFVGYKAIVDVCPGTQNYNPSTKRCEDNYKCIPTPATPGTCSLHKVEEDPTSCRNYRKCILGQWRTMTCPLNLRYNSTLRICLPAFAVACGSRPT